MRKIHLLFVSNNLNRGSGVAEYIYKLCKGINKKKFQIDIFLYDYNDLEYIKELKNNYKINIFYYNDKKSTINFKEILNKNKYDIVELHAPIYSFRYLKIAKKYGVPIRICHAHSIIRSTSKLKNILSKYMNIRLKDYANTYFACSKLAAQYWYNNVNNNNYYYIPNFINEPQKKDLNFKNKIMHKYKISENNLILGYIGRISKEKNITFLIKIINMLNIDKKNKYKLFLIGSGKEKYIKKIKNMIGDYNIENVFLVGYKENIYDWLSIFNLFIFPSQKEGLGMSLVEAQLSDTFCVAHKSMPEETNIGKIIYLENNVNIWVNYIKNFKNDSNNVDYNNFQKRKNMFNNDLNILKLERLYSELIKGE